MSVEEIYCAKCHTQTDETLLLSCDHNLCIQCAASTLSHTDPLSLPSSQIVTCLLCNSQTEIDLATSKEILSLALSPSSNGSPYPNASPSYEAFPFSNPPHSASSSLFAPLPREVCPEHGEPITYLCFDCLSKCVCAECVVHGVHRNHEVINIKKAYPMISEQTEGMLTTIEDKVKDLSYMSTGIENKKIELSTMNEKCKRDVKVAFEEMRMKLNKKEKDILDRMDAILKDNLNELNTYTRLLQSKIISLNKMMDSIQAHLMRKDELTLINFYCENKNKIANNALLQDLKCIPDVNGVANMKINIDQKSFDNMMSALNALNFEVTTLKGIDVNSGINPQKYVMQRNLYGMSTGKGSSFSSGGGGVYNSKGNVFDVIGSKTN